MAQHAVHGTSRHVTCSEMRRSEWARALGSRSEWIDTGRGDEKVRNVGMREVGTGDGDGGRGWGMGDERRWSAAESLICAVCPQT
jgi:hypothetical protein